jgi:hypothetical protein
MDAYYTHLLNLQDNESHHDSQKINSSRKRYHLEPV